MYLLPQLQNGLLVAVALTGIIMLLGGSINAITSALAGRMYDSFGAKWPAKIGFVIAFIGAVMVSVVTTHSAIWYMLLAHIILMIGAPLAMSPSQTSALNSLKGLESADGSAAFKFTNDVRYGMYFTIALTIIGFIVALFVKDDGKYTD